MTDRERAGLSSKTAESLVGIVVVSHSAKLAAGVVDLAREMAGPDVRIVAAGGIGEHGELLGTDVAAIQHAVEQVYSDAGVVVLMDLGSALLSAEMALEELPDEWRSRVVLCDAPLVEGSVAAAVQARLGSSVAEVVAEARAALAPKVEHLKSDTPALMNSSPTLVNGGAALPELRLTVRNHLGIHARPAARIVQTARELNATVRIRNLTTGRGPANARSLTGLALLEVRQDHAIGVVAEGPDAQAALDAIRSLVAANFGEESSPAGPTEVASQAAPPASEGEALRGLAASPGSVVGPVRHLRASVPTLSDVPATDPSGEWKALVAALNQARSELHVARAAVANRASVDAASVLDAHVLLLDDDALVETARRSIFDDQLSAAAAWWRAVEAVIADYRSLEDKYLQARANDVADVGQRVLGYLMTDAVGPKQMSGAGILVAVDLSPADVALADPSLLQGICTSGGGPTSHGAILARSLGIPAVVGVGPAILTLPEGTPLLLDGDAGYVWPHPDTALVAERSSGGSAALAKARLRTPGDAITLDGHRVIVAANVSSAVEARAAARVGADGVGLCRTEFMFLGRASAPSEDEQVAAYTAIAEAMHGRPVVFRTLDVGGDKPLDYLGLTAEANPFLGRRGIRLSLDQPDVFRAQLRALVRVAARYPIRVMFPMVATLDEWRRARALVLEVGADVERSGTPAPVTIELGIMVEVPEAALLADRFAAEVDFFSIGTNDLSQYTLAADRGNPSVATLADPFQPGVVRLIRDVVEAAHRQRKPVVVCGEMAGDPLATPLLLGLGVDELSMSPNSISRVAEVVRGVDRARARVLVQQAVAADSADAVRQILAG